MSITKTTFRIAQRTERGPAAFELTLAALREVLPYCQIDCVQFNRTKFVIDATRYPQAIWQQLLDKKEWHPKLIFHLMNSLAEKDHAKRMAMQAEFATLINAPDSQVTVHGTMLYESEGTPDMLEATGIPTAKAYGCELQVDAYTEFIKRVQWDRGLEAQHLTQRVIYQNITRVESVEQPAVL